MFDKRTITELITKGGADKSRSFLDHIGKAVTQMEESLKKFEQSHASTRDIAKLRNEIEAMNDVRELFFEELEEMGKGNAKENARAENGGAKDSGTTDTAKFSTAGELSKTADISMLEKAELLEKEDYPSEYIRKETLKPDSDIENKNIDNGNEALNNMVEKAKSVENPEKLISKGAMYRREIPYL